VDKGCFLVVFQFDTDEEALRFYNELHGKKFHEFEPEVCHIFFVISLELETRDQPLIDSKFEKLRIDGDLNGGLNTYELPNCPVCLERLDTSISGVLTIQCNHSFHCNCLFAWNDLTCPVCRYSYSSEDQKCFECDLTTDLWACLLCGYVGCGRYSNGHAHIHSSEFDHFFSMELVTKRVWDYISNTYVHRLIQSSDENKLVSVEEDGNKASEIKLECESLLIAQLESQRIYYETKRAKSREDYEKEVKRVKQRKKVFKRRCKEMKDKMKEFTEIEEKWRFYLKENSIIKARMNDLIKLNSKLNEALKAQKNSCASLEEKSEADKERIKGLLGEIKELKDEQKELYLHIEIQNKLDPEVVHGSFEIKKKGSNQRRK
jgi:BRCA1-associated protein